MALPEKMKVRINIVAFIVLGLGMSYWMATQILSVLQTRYSVLATFPDAGGVFTNQEVTYRGITVGQVGKLRVVPEGVEIELLIEEKYEVPADDVEARVMFKSAVGEQFVDLLPESDDPPFLEDGSKIPIEQTSIPVSTQELLSTLEAVLRGVPPEDLKGAIDALGEGLAGRGADLATIFESTADLAELFADRAPEIEGILRHGTTVGGAFLDSREDFAEAIRQLVPVSESLEQSTTDLKILLENTNLASDEVVALIRENRPDLYAALKRLAKVNDLQADNQDSLHRLFRKLPRGAQSVVNSFEPTTGMIRFALVTDNANSACSYGSERRSPEQRGNRKLPKRLKCEGGGGDEQSEGDQPASATSSDGGLARGATELPSVLGGSTNVRGPSLPARMNRWSWTLFYLHSI